MSHHTTILGSALVIAIGACGGTDGDGGKLPPPPIAVRVAPVSRDAISRPVIGTGTLGPKDEITLGFKVGGVVSRVAVDPGAQVRAGQVLATLDTREIDAAVTRAQSGAEKARRDHARAERLYRDSVFTLQQAQDAATANEVAQADLGAALFNRRYAVIVAPAGGVVLARRAEPGELVSPGTPILILGSRDRGSVIRVGLADHDLVRVRSGDRAQARFDVFPDRSFSGRVTEIAAAADPSTGTYTIEIALPDAGSLPSGLVGRVEILPATQDTATVVPIEAMLEADGSEATVFALSSDGSMAERRRVIVAFLTEDRVAVRRGLEAVRSVITDGAAYLRDGTRVKVIP
jgi:RND family efflux transporter MFP subunit